MNHPTPQLLRSTGFKLVASCTQVTSTALSFRAVLFYLISPAFYPFTFFPFSSVFHSFFLIPHTPPYYFPTPPYGSRVYLIPHTPILYILYIYYYSPSYLPVQRYYSFLSPPLSSLILFCCWYEDRIVYPFMPFFLWIHVSFGMRWYRYIYLPPWTAPYLGQG